MSSKSEPASASSQQVKYPMEYNRQPSSDEIDVLFLLQSFWRVRWGALIGALMALDVVITFQLFRPLIKYVEVPIAIDQSSSSFVTEPQNLVRKFNDLLGSDEVIQNIAEEVAPQTPGYQDQLRKAGLSPSSLTAMIISPGSGPLVLLPSVDSNDLQLLTALPLGNDNQIWLQSLIKVVNRPIYVSNEQYRQRLKNISRETIGEIIEIASLVRTDKAEDFYKSLSRSADAKLKLGSLLSQLQPLSDSKFQNSLILRGGDTRESDSSISTGLDILIDLAFIETAKALQSGRLNNERAQSIKNKLIAVKVDLNEADSRMNSMSMATFQIRSSIEKIDQALRKDLDSKGGLLPKLLLRDENVDQGSLGSFKNKKWLLTSFAAALVGSIFGGIGLGLVPRLTEYEA
jgi:hypothetical protein